MIRIQNITSEPIQRHTIIFQESEITLVLRFYPRNQVWCFDAEYKDWAVYGIKLSLGVRHIKSQNKPFDFFVTDRSNNGIDPFRSNDFSGDRCRLYMFEPDEMVNIRGGAEVPI